MLLFIRSNKVKVHTQRYINIINYSKIDWDQLKADIFTDPLLSVTENAE